MSATKVFVIWAALVTFVLAGCAANNLAASNQSAAPLKEAILARARVIYVAEEHNDPSHHWLQERIIRSLHRRGQPLTVGMEMIDVTQQPALDDYLAGAINWREFARSTDFDRGWGKTSPAYKRILAWCRRNKVPVLGLNAPRSVTRKLARAEKLTALEARSIPNFPEPPGSFEKFQAAMTGHPGSRSLRRYYEAQRAWEMTMAGRILAWLSDHTGTMVVLLGRFHADPQSGVPWYVARSAKTTQVIICPGVAP